MQMPGDRRRGYLAENVRQRGDACRPGTEVTMEQISKRLMSWASILDDGTRQQAMRTATLPFIFPHLALMPDAHLGKGATVGRHWLRDDRGADAVHGR